MNINQISLKNILIYETLNEVSLGLYKVFASDSNHCDIIGLYTSHGK
jgi:hypothetical protein